MSAEILRRAAALMRERAEGATDGGFGWRSTGEERTCEVWAPRDAANHDAFMVATTLTRLNGNPSASAQADAEHIASWHPAVALAVADLLDEQAEHVGHHPDESCCAVCDIASAYLGAAHA